MPRFSRATTYAPPLVCTRGRSGVYESDDDRQHGRDRDRDRQDEVRRRRRGRDQDDERRLGRVGDRRERVGREDRQRERLREQRLVHLPARARAADQRRFEWRAGAGAHDPHARAPLRRLSVGGLKSFGVDEAVSSARLREQVSRPRRVGLDLAAQLGDVDVEVVRLGLVRGAPDLAQDRPVREELALVQREEPQQAELVRGELEQLAVSTVRLLLEVDLELADPHTGSVAGCVAPQRRTEAREQLVHPERLRHVVVGAGVERRDLLALVPDDRQDDDRRVAPPRSSRQTSTPLLSGSTRSRMTPSGGRPRRSRAPPLRSPPSRSRSPPRQRRLERTQDLRLVVDDEDSRALTTRSTPEARRPAGSARTSRRRTFAALPLTVPPFAPANPLAIARPRPCPRRDARSPARTARRLVRDRRGGSRPVVHDRDDDVSLSLRRRRARPGRREREREGVLEQVHEHVLDLRAVDLDRGKSGASETFTRSPSSAELASAWPTRSSTVQSSGFGVGAPTSRRERSRRFATSRSRRRVSV